MVLILLPNLGLHDLRDAESQDLKRLMEEGALGLMNTRTGDGYRKESAYVTLGAGRRALGGGRSYPILLKENGGEAQVLHYQGLYHLNQQGNYGATPGLLGSYLQENQLERALITTSADLCSVLLLMDKEGMSPNTYHLPFCSLLLGEKNLSPLLEEALKRSDILLLQLSALEELEILLGPLLLELDRERDRILLLSPAPSKESLSQGSNLTPMLAYGQGVEGGLLSSKSTRQRALVTNLDLLPTILDFFSITPRETLPGESIEVIPGSSTIENLYQIHRPILFNATYRPSLIKFFVFFQIILLALFFLLFLLKFLPFKYLLALLCRFLFSIPSVFLLLGLFPGGPLFLYLLFFLLLSLSLALLAPAISPEPLDHALLFSFLVVALILLDLLLGPALLNRSILGYDPIIGARFYGLGNEYMGILLGASIMGSAALWDRLPRLHLFIPTLLFFLLIALFMGLPFLGANLGGTLTALFLFSLALLLLKREPLRLKRILIIALFPLLLLLTFLLLEALLFKPFQSHIGKTLDLARGGGIQEIYPIITRKIGMNLKLMRWTIWTRVLLSFTLSLLLFFKQPYGPMERALKEHPHLYLGLKTAVFGSLVTMIVNDSGVVAMATLLFFPVFTIFYLILHALQKEQTSL